MVENLFQVVLAEHGLELAGGMAPVSPFLEDFVGHEEGIVHGNKTHRSVNGPVVLQQHAFRFREVRVGHVALDMAGTHVLDLVDAHVTHDEVLVAQFGIAQALVAGPEEDVAALRLDDGIYVLDIAAAHETVGAGFVVRLVEETLPVLVHLVADRDLGLVTGFDIKQASRHVATVVLPSFKVNLSFRHCLSLLITKIQADRDRFVVYECKIQFKD